MCNNSNNDNLPARVIYIAESPEQVINYKWHSESKFLDKNIAVMEVSAINQLAVGNKHFSLPSDLTPGEVLIRHPYYHCYLKATEAEDKLLSDSAESIFLIARALGATKIEYQDNYFSLSKRTIDTENKGKYKVVEVNIDVQNSKEQKMLRKIKKTRIIPKIDFTEETFENAKKIAEERGLMASQEISSLLDARNPRLGAPIARQTVIVDMLSSLDETLDIAFTLNVVPVFNLSSKTKIATENKTMLSIVWDIIFDDSDKE